MSISTMMQRLRSYRFPLNQSHDEACTRDGTRAASLSSVIDQMLGQISSINQGHILNFTSDGEQSTIEHLYLARQSQWFRRDLESIFTVNQQIYLRYEGHEGLIGKS